MYKNSYLNPMNLSEFVSVDTFLCVFSFGEEIMGIQSALTSEINHENNTILKAQ